MRTMPVLAIGLCGLIFSPPALTAVEHNAHLAGLHVSIWPPEGEGAFPVVVFSHGFHGCVSPARGLLGAIADAGYLVLAPLHRDATCDGGAGATRDGPERPWGDGSSWTEATHRDRAEDIQRLVAALREDPAWRERADLSRLALAGHSLGGYTVLGLAGAWPAWRMPGVAAVLAFSPYLRPFLAHGMLGGLSAPVMYQGGTRDHWITPDLQQPGGAYDRSPPPKYYVAFRGADHLAWGGDGDDVGAEIIAYSRAFLDRYAKGLAPDPVLTRSAPGVAALRYESEVGLRNGDLAPVEPPPRSVRQRLRALIGR